MTPEHLLEIVDTAVADVETAEPLSSSQYQELRHMLDSLAADPGLPIGAGEIIETALVWLWALTRPGDASESSGHTEVRSRLLDDLAIVRRLITGQPQSKSGRSTKRGCDGA